jgi:hypothetical protein
VPGRLAGTISLVIGAVVSIAFSAGVVVGVVLALMLWFVVLPALAGHPRHRGD